MYMLFSCLRDSIGVALMVFFSLHFATLPSRCCTLTISEAVVMPEVIVLRAGMKLCVVGDRG